MILSFCREGDTCGPEVVFCGLSSARPHRARQSSRVDWPLIRQGKRVCQFLKLLSGNKKIFWFCFFYPVFTDHQTSPDPVPVMGALSDFWTFETLIFVFLKLSGMPAVLCGLRTVFFSPSTFILSLQVHHPNANSFTPWTDFLFPLWNHLFLLW